MKQTLKMFITRLRVLFAPLFTRYNQKMPYIITFFIAIIVVVGGINLFIELTETLTTDVLVEYDQQITEYVLSYRSPGLTSFFLFMTYLGDVNGYLIVLAVYLMLSIIILKKWKYVLQTFLVLVLATVSNMVLKRFIDRARPGIEHLVSVETLSYPSGHAMSAMAFYGFLIYLFLKFNMNRYLKLSVILILTLLILSIGISRIYLGVHYPSDIAGGYIAGALWVIFCIVIFDLVELFRMDPKT